jgi:anthranilate/para-aminobenzoate synthase component II
MLLMIDNYDSFTFNLVQYLLEMGEDVRVFRNDAITVEEIEGLGPERIGEGRQAHAWKDLDGIS